MAKTTSINSQMFFALKVSEKSGVPFLFMSAPGMGKSTTVEIFAENNGYEMEILRGNSTSETEVMGYDVVDSRPGAKSTIHLRPSWFENVMENAKNSKRTLLFVDEITTCLPNVQAALLHLIFERKVGKESIPEDTLIVSAGNYSSSLGSNFALIPPLMNRFCIFNIIPTGDNLTEFLLHHDGAAIGSCVDFRTAKRKQLEKMSNMGHAFSNDDIKNRSLEIIEKAFYDTTRLLMAPSNGGKEGKVDLKVTDVQAIYTDVDNDDPLRGFVTMRTLNYAIKTTVATWELFGKKGIESDSYLNILQGLVGLGLHRDSNHQVKASFIANDYHTRIKGAFVEIEKLDNNSVIEFNEFFVNFFKNEIGSGKNATLTTEQAGILNVKLQELKRKKELANVSKPIDVANLEKIIDYITSAMKPIGNYKLGATGATLPSVSDVSGAIGKWNIYSDLFTVVGETIETPEYSYDKTTLDLVSNTKDVLFKMSCRFNTVVNLLHVYCASHKDEGNNLSLIPQVHTDYVKPKKD